MRNVSLSEISEVRMPRPQIMTSTGLISAPLTEVVKYDSKWSYCVSHNSQTSRFVNVSTNKELAVGRDLTRPLENELMV